MKRIVFTLVMEVPDNSPLTPDIIREELGDLTNLGVEENLLDGARGTVVSVGCEYSTTEKVI